MDLLSQMFARKAESEAGPDERKSLAVIIKASTQGTLEAVLSELDKVQLEDATLNILTAAVGEVSEQDINRAKLAKGIVLSFQRPTNKKIEELAKKERVLVRNYEIIYEMVNEIQAVLESMLVPAEIEVEVARASVKQVFKLTNGDMVLGCDVTKGTIIRGYNCRLERKGEEIGRSKITSLKHFKEEVKEARKGLECGIILNPVIEAEAGDEVVTYKIERN